MEFILANQELLVTAGVLIAVLALGLYIAPLLKKKGIIKADDLQFTAQLMQIVSLVLNEVKFKDEESKERASAIVKIAQAAIVHVNETMDENATIEQKKGSAYLVAIKTLNEFGIEVTESRSALIRVVIDNAYR